MQTVVKSRAAKSLQILPGTLCPFLYQTRTITNQQSRPPPSSEQSRKAESTTLTFLQRKARDVEARRQTTESTITRSEREIFTNIMKNFGAKIDGLGILPSQSPSSEPEQHQESQAIKGKPKDVPLQPQIEPSSVSAKNTNIDDILSIFAPADTNEAFSVFSGSTNNASPEPEKESSTSSEPNPLNVRNAALQSLQHISTSCKTALSSSTTPPDLALWRILEAEIFPLMTLMSIHRSPLNVNPYERLLSSLPTEALPASISSLPPDTPFLPLITILYPAATLLALRTYIAHLPTSGFIPALLPKIRSLGPAAYMLAGNTHFFNALMYIQWTVYSDLRGVYLLLSEMRRNGVESDQVTLKIIDEISTQRERDMVGEEGKEVDSRARDWWGLKRQEEGWHKVMGKYRYGVLKEKKGGKMGDEDHEQAIDREIM